MLGLQENQHGIRVETLKGENRLLRMRFSYSVAEKKFTSAEKFKFSRQGWAAGEAVSGKHSR